MQAKKRYGQNFLIDKSVIAKIVDSIEAKEDDLIIEIGPGRGALTHLLKKKNANLIAYEIDTDMHKYLDILNDSKTQIIYQDFLSTNLDDFPKFNNLYIVGNLPYYITTPILEHIIKSKIDPKEMVIMVQKEVADRFLARPNTKDYGYFTLFLHYFFDIERVVNVSSDCFNPVPKVDSTVIKLKRREIKPNIDIEKYQKVLKMMFAQKRKQLKNNLGLENFEKIKDILKENKIDENVRAEQLSEETIIKISNKL